VFPCIEQAVKDWRRKFLAVGATFEWYCVEVKHFNCFNELEEDESFICWDRYKRNVWVREPPSYAIREHPLLNPRADSYQDFLPRLCMDGITITGVRAAESIQRLKNIAVMTMAGNRITSKNQILPVYDWTNNDVWLYLNNEHIDIPVIYLYLWQSGTGKGQLRVSQFFSVDTAKSLVKMNEYYPGLMDRVIRREPNAYLASLYWDSEMFGRRSRKRRELEGNGEGKDYKALLLDMFNNMDIHFRTPHKRQVAERYRGFTMKVSAFADQKDYQMIYEALIRGDPKMRTFRALYQRIYGRYIDNAKKARAGEGVSK